ncbi:MAG: PP2C family protein-serine/threonine phosphatase [Bdellovibrionales bacterium]
MKSKLLKRLLKKGFAVSSRGELHELLIKRCGKAEASDSAAGSIDFVEEMMTILDTVDRAICDSDRVIEIRDRTLAISSAEMTSLTNEIRAHSERQASVLRRLQTTVDLLAGSNSATGQEQDIEKLVVFVEQLVQHQMNSAELQKLLYQEGLKICSVLNFKSLEFQIKSSFRHLTGADVRFSIFFCGNLFEGKDPIDYYQCDEHNQAIENKKLSMAEQKEGVSFINIDSPGGNGRLAIIQIGGGSQAQGLDLNMALERISPLVPSIASTLENIKLLKEEKHKQYMENELNTIRIVQQTLLPPSSPNIFAKDIEVNGYYQSATECGGDWWTHFTLPDQRHVVLLGDVTGHGTGSAMVCAVVKGYCDSFLNQPDFKISKMLSELNAVVYRISKDLDRAMTMAALVIDTKLNKVVFSNAGHPLPIHIAAGSGGGAIKHLSCSGPILGFSAEAEFIEMTYDFNFGDKIVLYSDGLVECPNRQDVMYGEGRLRRLIASAGVDKTAANLNSEIIKDLKNFCLGEGLKDDLTTVVVRNLSGA